MNLQREQEHPGSYFIIGVMSIHGKEGSSKNRVGYGSHISAEIFIQENDCACCVSKQLQKFRCKVVGPQDYQ